MSRPENQLPAEQWYSLEEAQKYSNCSRIIEIQQQMTERALELLDLKEEHQLLLDIGCGSGISGSILTQEEHFWVGIDISTNMLNVAQEHETEGELIEGDIGQGFNLKASSFDGCISISAVQWLCVAAKKAYNPYKRLQKFFDSLFKCLKQEARAVLQIYPDGKEQLDMITKAAMKSGFQGHLVVDYPNSTKAKKLYLVLDTCGRGQQSMQIVEGLQEESEVVHNNTTVNSIAVTRKTIDKQKKVIRKSKQWINNKKDRQRKQGKQVRDSSKFTGRSRSGNLGCFN